MRKEQIVLFAEPSERSIELRKEIEKLGLAVSLVFCASGPGVPYVESPLTTIRGYENIRRFFATENASR
jgi:hypothetical protein